MLMFLKPIDVSRLSKMDSISLSHFNKFLMFRDNKTDILELLMVYRFRLTFKAGFNQKYSGVSLKDINDGRIDIDDGINLTVYDLRAMFYINKRFKIIGRAYVIGTYLDKYEYDLGLAYKFK